MANSVDDAFQSMWQNLAEKTGRDRAAWISLARSSGLAKHKELVNWLKAEHQITHGYANQVALAALAKDEAAPSGTGEQITALFSGAKAGLQPIYDELIEILNGLGDDVEQSPKKTYISLRRKKQFGIV